MNYLITIERDNKIVRAFSWEGSLQAGIAYARVEVVVRGIKGASIFASPVANKNKAA